MLLFCGEVTALFRGRSVPQRPRPGVAKIGCTGGYSITPHAVRPPALPVGSVFKSS